MSDTAPLPVGHDVFRGVILVEDPDRAMKLLTGTGNLYGLEAGALRVVGSGLEWTASGRAVTLSGVTYLDVVRDGVIGVDYQGPDGPRVAALLDRSRGQFKAVKTTATLARTLRDALGLAPKTPEEQAAATKAVVDRADARIRAARIRMFVAGGVAAAGGVATYVGYSNADPGDSYTIWWGAVAFGLLWFIAGIADYVGAAKQKDAALAQPSESAASSTPSAEPASAFASTAPAAPVPQSPAPPPWMPSDERRAGGGNRRVLVLAGLGVLALVVAVAVALSRGGDDDPGEIARVDETDTDSDDTASDDTDLVATESTPVGQPPPVASSTTTAAPAETAPVSNTVDTSLGPATISDIRFIDRSPPGCQPIDPSCASSTGNRLVLFMLQAPAGANAQTMMNSMTDEFFASRIVDAAGGVAFAKSISTVGDSAVEVVYDEITVDNPTTLTLEWPGASPISLPL